MYHELVNVSLLIEDDQSLSGAAEDICNDDGVVTVDDKGGDDACNDDDDNVMSLNISDIASVLSWCAGLLDICR